MPKTLFATGPLTATPGALDLLQRSIAAGGPTLIECGWRHVAGDFGLNGKAAEITLTADERARGPLATADGGKLNLLAIENGGRVLSIYDTPGGRLWVITDGLDAHGMIRRGVTYTTFLTPDEY